MSNGLRIAVVSGILAFAGAIAGNYLTGYLEERRAERQFTLQYRVHLLDKRLAVMEKCTNARAQFPRAKVLSDYEKTLIKQLQSQVTEKSVFPQSGPPKSLLDMQKELTTIVSDYSVCVQLGGELFGPRTEKASQQIDASQVFDPNDPKLTALLKAMAEEIAYFRTNGSK
jgi:hypothetical protein